MMIYISGFVAKGAERIVDASATINNVVSGTTVLTVW